MLRVIICFAALFLVGCGEKKEPKEYLQAAEKLTGVKVPDIEKIKKDFLELKAASERDYDELKELCAEFDKRYNQRILTWYANVLFIEGTRGIDAAQDEIQRLKRTENLSAIEVKALKDIDGYFKEKGKISTAVLLVGIYAIYLEAEYGHGASAPLGAVLEIMGKEVQPGAAANGSQPIHSDTNSTSTAAGSRR
jgi:hypothetical protein